MRAKSSRTNRWAWFSPWMIIGFVCILAGILLFLAVKNVHREKEFMEGALLSQANVLMRSVEAGSRTGMRGMGWGRRQYQTLLEEMAQQSDVLYIALINPAGRIAAHSDPDLVDKVLPVALPETGETSHRFSDKDPRAFEVVRAFQPWFRQRGHGSMNMCDWCPTESGRDLFIVVGLDPAPFEGASEHDLHQTMLLFGIMFLVGAAGFISLFWAHSYRSAGSALQEMRAFTSTIVNQMPIGLIMTDPEGRVERTNEAAQHILRCAGKVQERIDDLPCFLPIARALKEQGAVAEQEIQCRVSDTASIPLLVNAALIRDGEQKTTGHVYLFSDITNTKQLEEQVRRGERLAGLGKLAAGVAHEIRNPLSSIKGFATILAGRFKEDERSHELAEVMVHETERLNRVVTELLDYAKPTEISRQALSCRELIDNSIRLVERDALRKGVRIETSVEPENLVLEADPDRFAQSLLNLYLNAIQAMEDGGTLSIKAMCKDGHAILKIADTGAGISPEDLPHIFDPYFTTKPKGVGLGLANVHKFVEAHGGRIEATSLPGKGTVFTVKIPTGKSRGAIPPAEHSGVNKNG